MVAKESASPTGGNFDRLGGSGGDALGNNGVYCYPPPLNPEKLGTIDDNHHIPYRPHNAIETPKILNRWELQDVSTNILKGRWDDRYKSLIGCLRWRRAESNGVEVFFNALKNGVKLGGLQTCGKVHTCPHCSFRIARERRKEVKRVIDLGRWKLVLVTLTVHHTKRSSLKKLLGDMQEAINHMRAGSKRAKFFKYTRAEGYIRGLEVLLGRNHGWHPHYHELLFIPNDEVVDLDVIHQFYERYVNKLRDIGYYTNRFTIDVREAVTPLEIELAGGYLMKDQVLSTGLDWEVTSGVLKKGKGITPFQVLQASYYTGKDYYTNAWREYVNATHGVKKINWSKGFKEKYLPEEDIKTDEEIIEEVGDGFELLFTMFGGSYRKLDDVFGGRGRLEWVVKEYKGDVDKILAWLLDNGIIDDIERGWMLALIDRFDDAAVATTPIDDGGRGGLATTPIDDGGRGEADAAVATTPIDDGGRGGLATTPIDDGGRGEGDAAVANLTDRKRLWAESAIDSELRFISNAPQQKLEKGGNDVFNSFLRIASIIKGDGSHISEIEAYQAITIAISHFEYYQTKEKDIHYQWRRAYRKAKPRYMREKRE